MAKRRRFYMWDIPHSVAAIVKSVCADYSRRQNAIESESVSGEVRAEYVRINTVIDAALDEIEKGIKEMFLRDIVDGRGYAFSPASLYLAKNSYYNRKRKLVHDIAVGLNLIP